MNECSSHNACSSEVVPGSSPCFLHSGIQDNVVTSIRTSVGHHGRERRAHTLVLNSSFPSTTRVLISLARVSHVAVRGQRSSVLMGSELENWCL